MVSYLLELEPPEHQWAERKSQGCCQSVRERKEIDPTKGQQQARGQSERRRVKEKSDKCKNYGTK